MADDPRNPEYVDPAPAQAPDAGLVVPDTETHLDKAAKPDRTR
jgi:hypothetical protein